MGSCLCSPKAEKRVLELRELSSDEINVMNPYNTTSFQHFALEHSETRKNTEFRIK